MKRLFRLLLAILVATFLTVPGWARHGIPEGDSSSGHAKKSHHWRPHLRSNKGREVHGKERAEEVQEMNKRADSKRGFKVAPGVEKAETHTNKNGKGKK